MTLAAVQSPVTGLLGGVALIAGLAALSFIPAGALGSGALATYLWEHRFVCLLVAVFLPMATYELAVVRVYRRHLDFSRPRPFGPELARAVFQRSLGVTVMLALAWTAYGLLDLYRRDEFRGFLEILVGLTCVALIVAPVYYVVMCRFGRDDPTRDADDMGLLGSLCVDGLGGVALWPVRRDAARARLARARALLRHPGLANLARWGGVKLFFLPWMTIWFLNNCSFLTARLPQLGAVLAGEPSRALVVEVYGVVLTALFTIDLALSLIGYACTLKLLDTHVASAEPTLSGWTVALLCYPPFGAVANAFIPHGGDRAWIAESAALDVSLPWLCVWAAAILVLIGIYTWATMMFGLRFSNLTNRGILSRGAYAIVRHPAYVSKNLAWWLMVVPFLRSPQHVFALLAWNAIYVMRALTEERHLARDPHYREYCRKVRWRFIPGVY